MWTEHVQYQLPLSDSMASRSRKIIPNSQVLALINESDDSDPVYSSEDEFKPTKSDMETESSSENGK